MLDETVKLEVKIPRHYADFLKCLEARGLSLNESIKSCVIFDLNSIDTDIKNIEMTHDINIRQELSDGESIFKQVT